MTDRNNTKPQKPFDFEGEMTQTTISGFDYKNIFSPSEPLTDMPKRMEARIKKIRKMRRKCIFPEPFKAPNVKNS